MVVIVERDKLSADACERASVPHGFQVHTLLPGGSAQIERWFPGFTAEAVNAGAVLSGPQRSAVFANGRRRVVVSHPPLLSCSRTFLEGQIRRYTLDRPNVKLISAPATGLIIDDTAVCGVRYAADAGEVAETADLVVDAMGRASRLTDWLEQCGWERPVLNRLKSGINYLTGYFTRRDADPGFGMLVATFSSDPEPDGIAGIAANAIEGNRWMVTVARYGNDQTPLGTEAFVKSCRKYLPPGCTEVVAGDLVSPLTPYYLADSRRREFHCLSRIPARLISVGDAVASFNPLYGQGMSSAALQASCLSAYLNGAPDLAEPAREFFGLQRIVIDAAWAMSTAGDRARLRMQRPPKRQPLKTRTTAWLTNQVLTASMFDPVVAERFVAVTHMRTHPQALATPEVIARAIIANLRHPTNLIGSMMRNASSRPWSARSVLNCSADGR
jgi:2-polyprenyl-6-methoxyphenol hydroxylase-like FAD-dependent oxidoreductase